MVILVGTVCRSSEYHTHYSNVVLRSQHCEVIVNLIVLILELGEFPLGMLHVELCFHSLGTIYHCRYHRHDVLVLGN